MRVAVLGAGAIGAYVGARLAEGGSEVVLIARGAHLAAIRMGGLRVIDADGERTMWLESTGELDAVTGADAVIVALKAHSLPAIAPALGSMLTPGTPTVWAQNGIPWWYFHGHGGPLDGLALESVDPGGVIAASIPAEGVVGAVVHVAAELVAPGVVRHVEGRRFSLCGPGEAISAALRAGGLRAPLVGDLRSEIWLKLLGNATFNPVTALSGATLGQLGELPEMRELLLDAFAEIERVAAALDVQLALSPQRRLEAGLAVGEHRTSMLQDRDAGRPLEHRALTGAVVEIAARLGVEVPRIQTLHACVEMLERAQRLGGSERA